MPTTLLYRDTMNESKGIVDETRAFQLARELSLLGINGNCRGQGLNLNHGSEADHQHHISRLDYDEHMHNGHMNMEPSDCVPHDINTGLTDDGGVFASAPGCANRKSANMTETVPVPSSEHVAEIVGRQGCKIKALRAKTNTYIKTPVRGEEPVFVVTGRREDVARAKHEILSAAEHFSQIRASRRTANTQASGSGSCSPICVPGHVTIQVRVPYKVVGLVVGPKGATIKRIQQATSTYIVTPGRDKEPVFEVTGLPDNVDRAREEIEKHIASRTGSDNNSDLQIDDFNVNGIDSSFHDHTSSDSANTNNSDGYGSFSSKNAMNGNRNGDSHLSVVTSHSSNPTMPSYHHHQHHQVRSNGCNGMTGNGCNAGGLVRSCSCCSTGPSAMKSHHNRNGGDEMHSTFAVSEYMKQYNSSFGKNYNHAMMNCSNGCDQYDIDEGIGASGGSIFDPTATIWGNDVNAFSIQRSNSIGVSSARILPPGEDSPHPRTRRTNSDPLAAAFQAAFSTSSRSSSQASTSPVTGRRNNERPHHTSATTLSTATPSSGSTSAIMGPCISCGFVETSGNPVLTCGHNSLCIKCASGPRVVGQEVPAPAPVLHFHN